MHQQNNGEELIISIGEIIEYESRDGEIYEGEVLGISTTNNQVQVLRLVDLQIIQTVEWVSVEDIFIGDDENDINSNEYLYN